MKSKSKNVTFTLPEELIEKYKTYATNDLIPSINAGVREALEIYCIRMDREVLAREMQKAATDPLFLQDLKETMDAFEHSDAEQGGKSTEW